MQVVRAEFQKTTVVVSACYPQKKLDYDRRVLGQMCQDGTTATIKTIHWTRRVIEFHAGPSDTSTVSTA